MLFSLDKYSELFSLNTSELFSVDKFSLDKLQLVITSTFERTNFNLRNFFPFKCMGLPLCFFHHFCKGERHL